jgi:radical SAM-linked protein
MRLFQRALRRAGIELRMSQGFNPHPKMSFALPLGVGIESDCEILLIDTSRWYRAAEINERLQAELPHGMELLDVTLASPQASAVPRDVTYVVTPGESDRDAWEGIKERADSFLESRKVEVERIRRDRKTRIDVRPYVGALDAAPEGMKMRMRVTPKGTAKPGEILRVLGVDPLTARIRRIELNLNP